MMNTDPEILAIVIRTFVGLFILVGLVVFLLIPMIIDWVRLRRR